MDTMHPDYLSPQALEDLEARKQLELTSFTDYTTKYLNDPNMRRSPEFYQDVENLRDSMYRFSGNEYSPVHDKRMAEWYDQAKNMEARDWTLGGGPQPLLDVNKQPIVPYEGENIVDTLWKRYNFMDPTNAGSLSKLANIVTLYNLNPGADRYEQASLKNLIVQQLGDHLSAGGTTEQFLMTFTGKKPQYTAGTWNPAQQQSAG